MKTSKGYPSATWMGGEHKGSPPPGTIPRGKSSPSLASGDVRLLHEFLLAVGNLPQRDDRAGRIAVLVETEGSDDRVEVAGVLNVLQNLSAGRHLAPVVLDGLFDCSDDHLSGDVAVCRVGTDVAVELCLVGLDEGLGGR